MDKIDDLEQDVNFIKKIKRNPNSLKAEDEPRFLRLGPQFTSLLATLKATEIDLHSVRN